jgi:hypothetical protein
MIKFFRKIRQQMLIENKFFKYLTYAVGEIILVVVGILIALSINNNNDAEKLRLKEIILLTEMSENLRTDMEDLDFNIRGNIVRTQANEIILEALQNRVPMHDSLKVYYGGIWGSFQTSENTAAWATLQSVGLDLISSDSLRSAISNIYTVKYKYLENLEHGLDERYQMENLYPQVLELINIEQVWVSAEPVDHDALADNRKFQETLKLNLFIRNYMQDQYTRIYNHVHVLRERIQKHIQSLKDQ